MFLLIFGVFIVWNCLQSTSVILDPIDNCENKEIDFVYCYGKADDDETFGLSCISNGNCSSWIKIQIFDDLTRNSWKTIVEFTFQVTNKQTTFWVTFSTKKDLIRIHYNLTEKASIYISSDSKTGSSDTRDVLKLNREKYTAFAFNYTQGDSWSKLGFNPFEKDYTIEMAICEAVNCSLESSSLVKNGGNLKEWNKFLTNESFRYDNCFALSEGWMYPCHPFTTTEDEDEDSTMCIKNKDCAGLFYFIDNGDEVTLYLNVKTQGRTHFYIAAGLSPDEHMGEDLVFDCLLESAQAKAHLSQNIGHSNKEHTVFDPARYARLNGPLLECLWTLDPSQSPPPSVNDESFYLDSIMGRYKILLASGNLEPGKSAKMKHDNEFMYNQELFIKPPETFSIYWYIIPPVIALSAILVVTLAIYWNWDKIKGKSSINSSNENEGSIKTLVTSEKSKSTKEEKSQIGKPKTFKSSDSVLIRTPSDKQLTTKTH